MTPEDVRARVKYIRSISYDDEAAHAAEDDLWGDVLSSIATGECHDVRGCAAEAIKTSKIQFERWYA